MIPLYNYYGIISDIRTHHRPAPLAKRQKKILFDLSLEENFNQTDLNIVIDHKGSNIGHHYHTINSNVLKTSPIRHYNDTKQDPKPGTFNYSMEVVDQAINFDADLDLDKYVSDFVCVKPSNSSYIFTNSYGACLNWINKNRYRWNRKDSEFQPNHHPHQYNVSCKEIWGYWDSIYFAGSVVTTIGYGQIAPTTMNGRVFCMFYMPIGSTIFMIFFIITSQLIREKMAVLKNFVKQKFSKRYAKMSNSKQTSFIQKYLFQCSYLFLISTIFILTCIFLPALFFKKMESTAETHDRKGWSFIEAVYYVLATITTVGFGDYVPGKATESLLGKECFRKKVYDTVYEAATLFWIIPAIVFTEIVKEKIVNWCFFGVFVPILGDDHDPKENDNKS